MMAPIGYLTLALAFLLAIYGFLTMIWGLIHKSFAWKETARLALVLIFPLISVSLLSMLILLAKLRFDVAYVYSVTNRNMLDYLRLTALWGGQSGSLLFWSWMLAGFSMIFAISERKKAQGIFPWACLILLLILGFFLAMNLFIDNPFERFWYLEEGGWLISTFKPQGGWPLVPQDGQGLNPLLRHTGMILHPPALYLGFTGFAVPFALAVGSLAAGRKDRHWLKLARPWLLFAWVFLTLGLVLGMRWAYDVLGWGGYWGWDPVEISALLPWLSSTALLHTSLLQRKRDGYRRWTISLIILTFSLVIFSIFATRSGVLVSVHSFAESAIGSYLLFFLLGVTLGATILLTVRWKALRGTHTPDFKFSREVLTLFTNIDLLSILAVCLLGVMYPSITQLVMGSQVTVSPAWYKRITGPLFILLVFLMGICPLAGWSTTTFNRFRKRLLIVVPISLLLALLAWLLGVKSTLAIITLWIASLSACIIFADYFNAVWIALTQKSKHFFGALWAPISNKHRRYGGLIVHLGIVLMSVGIIGIEGLQQETQEVRLSLGEGVMLGGYQFTFEGLENYFDDDERNITEAVLAVSREERGIGTLHPQRQIYLDMNQVYTQPGLMSNLVVDLYAILVDWRATPQEEATVKIFVTPLVNWLWIGAGLLTLGTIVAGLPDRKGRIDEFD